MSSKVSRISILALVAMGLCVLGTANAQPMGSYVPLQPCQFAMTAAGAGTTTFYLVRGSCNVPQEAAGVALIVTVSNPTGAGYLAVWESSLPRPNASSLSFKAGAGSTSTFAIARLCYPVEECTGEDLAVYVSKSATVTLSIAGYVAPPGL